MFNLWPPEHDQFWSHWHFINKLGRCYIQNIKALVHPVWEKENYKIFVLCSYVQLVTPRAGPVPSLGAFYEQTWSMSPRRCHIQNIKSLCLPVSEKKNFEHWLLCSYVLTCDPRGRASFDPRGIIWTNFVEVHKEMLYNKYQSSRPSSFREEEFWSLPSLFLCSNLWPPGRGQFWPRGDHLNKLGRNSLGDATH